MVNTDLARVLPQMKKNFLKLGFFYLQYYDCKPVELNLFVFIYLTFFLLFFSSLLCELLVYILAVLLAVKFRMINKQLNS